MKTRLETAAPGTGSGAVSECHDTVPGAKGRRRVPRRARRGISLFGVILGVAVAALVTAGLVSAYQGVVLNVRAGSVQTTFIGAVANVRRAFASATTFAGGRASMNAIIYSSAPDNFRNTNGSARDAGITFPWWEGSSKLIASATAAEHSADLFTLHLENVPPAVCEAVGAAFIGNSSVEQIAADKAAAIGGAGEVADTGVDLAANCANVDSDDDLTDLKIQFRG